LYSILIEFCIRVIKARRIRWAGYVARIGRGYVYIGFWWGKLRKETTWNTHA